MRLVTLSHIPGWAPRRSIWAPVILRVRGMSLVLGVIMRSRAGGYGTEAGRGWGGGVGGCQALGWDPKGQNRRLAGPGSRSLTLAAALAQLQGDDLPGQGSSDEAAPAWPGRAGVTAGTNAWQLGAQDVGSARSLLLLTRDARSARVCSAGLLSAVAAREPNLGIIFPHSSCSRNSAQARSGGHALLTHSAPALRLRSETRRDRVWGREVREGDVQVSESPALCLIG